MKRRDPQNFCGAIDRIKGDLTAEECGQVVGKSASLIRKWGDEDLEATPNINQAFALDLEHVRQGLSTPETAPIGSVWLRKLHAASGGVLATGSVEDELLDVPVAVGRLIETIRAARKDGRTTLNEYKACSEDIAAAIQELEELQAAVQASVVPLKGAAE